MLAHLIASGVEPRRAWRVAGRTEIPGSGNNGRHRARPKGLAFAAVGPAKVRWREQHQGNVKRMSYQAEISRASPTAIVMVMDQSSSMSHRLGSGQSKAAFLADVLNKTLYTLITSCSKADGVRDYFHVGVVA